MKNIFKIISIIIILLLSSVSLHSSTDTLAGMQTISIKNDAGILALGESGRSSVSGISALYLNPSRLFTIKDNELKVSYTKYFAEYNLFTLGYGHNFIKKGTVALSLSYFKSANLQLFNADGTEYGVAEIKDYLINLGYSYNIIGRYLSIGLNAKFLSSKIYNYSGTAYGVDIGIYSELLMFPLSIVVENLGTATFDSVAVSLPQAVSAALSYSAKYQDNIFTINFDTKSYIEIGKLGDVTYLFGCEYSYNFISIIGSYNLNTGEIGVGFGIEQEKFGIKVGYGFKDIEPVYSVDLKYNFSSISSGEEEGEEEEIETAEVGNLSSEEITQQIEELKAEKAKALAVEDFDKAAELKDKIDKLEEQLKLVKAREEKERLEKAKAVSSGSGDREAIKKQIEELKAEKKKALAAEDFDKAAELKDKIDKLEEQLSKGVTGVDREAIKKQIEELKAEKKKAIAAEDFDKAAELKDKIDKLEEQLK